MIVGFTGWATSGKDTAADQLPYPKTAFAAALKKDMRPVLLDLYGWDILNCTPERKEIMRPWLVGHGAGMRAGDPDYWIRRLIRPDAPVYSVSDVRYYNEVKWILDQGGIVFYLARPDVYPANPEEGRSILQLLRTFQSHERFYGVSNDGTVSDLGAQVRGLLNRHLPNPAWDAHRKLLKKESRRK